jgi:Fe-S cluster biogenesis protein NfuA
MPAWFSKLFKNGETAPASEARAAEPDRSAALASTPTPAPARPAAPRPTYFSDDDSPAIRKVVDPPVLADEEEEPASPSEIRIKARMERDNQFCVFMVDRPVLQGYSAWFPIAEAAMESPLAKSIFEVEGVDSVLIHDMNVTVGRDPFLRTDWEPWAREIGGRIREHLKNEEPVVTPAFIQRIPSEDEIRDRLETVINTEINPGIAAHSGAISLERVEGNTVYIRMMGGCQGCAASTITLRQGIHQAFREAVPEVGAILDQTDHTAGKNPYYRQLPAGMGTDA